LKAHRKFIPSIALIAALGASSLALPGCSRAAAAPRSDIDVQSSPALAALSGSVADVAEEAMPSVVSVAATKMTAARQQRGFPFPLPFGFQGPLGDPGPREQHGIGSGVIVDDNGVILTNNHVVAGAREIKVVTSDQREFEAEVVGTDPKSDLAVLRIKGNPKGLKALPLGNSSELRLG